ncbi:MerR family transcriptional regulator [Pseudodesulfovibrio sediminis]|uniref:MerR family transcriptional regulator n=1 Tax=Pseudodesulfovibrio sediminis TaxID=2810563 RepID=A0ABM7P7P1_9BACT|nr:MerR family transcriptional regulator [Pseudodesulfovibrio sediminis]BCS89490.1 MerR family transcriptional regulator [Pseudodesulfovibrio sediminis]
MKISELAQRLDVSPHTLRYYEKIGLIRDVDRAGGRRVYTENALNWMRFILRLKQTGMPLKKIQRYSDLRHKGDSTLSERKAMLLSHRQDLEENINQLQSHLVALDQKIEIYETLEKEYDALRAGIEKT